MALISKVLAVGMIAGAIMSVTGAAHAEDNDPPVGTRTCIVEYIDEHGNTIRRETVPEGTVVGPFVCRRGDWTFNFWPFNALVAGSTGGLTLDQNGSVADAVLDVDTRDGGLEVRELVSIVERLLGETADSAGRAVVVATERGELLPEDLTALLGGREVPGVRILSTTYPRPDTTLGDLGGSDDGSGVTAKKVVYRISKNWIFVGDVTCTTNKNGTKTCTIRGTIQRG
jgi:hypothetical protein